MSHMIGGIKYLRVGSGVYMFTFMGMCGELLLYQRILLPGKAKVFVVELSVQFNDVLCFAVRDSRWVLFPRVFTKIFCH